MLNAEEGELPLEKSKEGLKETVKARFCLAVAVEL